MLSHTSANPEIKQLYINWHFCYVFKFGSVTNGLGIIRHISFYNKDFMASHPDIVTKKKSDSPDEDKCVHDSKAFFTGLYSFEFTISSWFNIANELNEFRNYLIKTYYI